MINLIVPKDLVGLRPPHGTPSSTWHWIRYGSEDPEVAIWVHEMWRRTRTQMTTRRHPEDMAGWTYVAPCVPPA